MQKFHTETSISCEICPTLSHVLLLKSERGICHVAFADSRSLFSHYHNQAEAVLSQQELGFWKTIRSQNYRQSFLSGRILAKSLYTMLDHKLDKRTQLCQLEIRSRNVQNQGIRPWFFSHDAKEKHSLSISHSDDFVMVTLGENDQIGLGCDLVKRDSATKAMLRFFYTESENREIAATLPNARQKKMDCFWAAKEAAYKAVNQGEKFTPRHFDVTQHNDSYFLCRYRGDDQQTVHVFSVTHPLMQNEYAMVAFVRDDCTI